MTNEKLHLEMWGKTKNMTRICDLCWRDLEVIYLARKAREAIADKRPLNPAKRAASDQARATRAAKLLKHLPAAATSEAS